MVIHSNRLLFAELSIDLRLICTVTLISRNEENACWIHYLLCYLVVSILKFCSWRWVNAISACFFASIVCWISTFDMDFVSWWHKYVWLAGWYWSKITDLGDLCKVENGSYYSWFQHCFPKNCVWYSVNFVDQVEISMRCATFL